MNIQHSSHRNIFQAKQKDSVIQDLLVADDNLITQLTSLIDSLFAPLTWILEETLYRRVQKEARGWIKIDFLHRNKRFQSIFKKFEIPSHSRRKKNLINKAIQKSIIERKKNFIKRRKYLRIKQEVKKVVYLELKDDGFNNNLAIKSMMSERVLRQMIGESLRGIIETRREKQHNSQRMQIEGEVKRHLDFNKIMSDIVFEGSLLKGNQTQSLNHNTPIYNDYANQQETSNQIFYRWCFIYFPSLQQEQVHRVLTDLQNIILSYRQPQKMELEKQMNNLNITEESIDKYQNFQKPNKINIYLLTKMISIHYPKYNEVCQEIGYTHVDYRKQAIKVKQKQKEKEKVRLLQSRYLDDKIDLVNEYHVKLQIEKEKRAYWEKRNKQIEEKIRKRQERRKNRMNRGQEPQKKKDLTVKLKQLFNIDQPKQQKPQPKSLNVHSQPISQHSMNGQPMKEQMKEDSVSSQMNVHGPGFKIVLPKYNQSEMNQSEVNSESFDKLEVEQKKIENQDLNELYESQENENDYDDMDSSGEEFELPKKRKRNRNSQTKKHKVIVKPNQHNPSKSKQQTGKNSASKSSKITQNHLPSRNGNSNNHSNKKPSNPNTSYNLRHKSPSQGSYLRMAGYAYDEEDYRKKEKKNQIYEDDQDEKHEQSSSRNMRPRRS